MKSTYRVAVLQSHPIQYFAPLFRRLSQDPEIDLTVLYCSKQGVDEYSDEGFGLRVQWDIPLLDGYRSKFLPNLRKSDQVAGFYSLTNVSIVRELLAGHYDALWVHGHSYLTYILAILVSKVLGIPVLMRCESHLLLQRSKIKRVLRRPLMSFFYRQLCRACLPIGTLNREFYSFHRVGHHRLFHVPYTVDNNFFMRAVEKHRGNEAKIKDDFGLPQDKPLIMFVSKFISRKRPMDLLQAYEQLRRGVTSAALVLVGSGEEEDALREYVRVHNVPDVFFLGFRNQSELPKCYAIGDIFVLPSENEPWGLVLNEVMCAGVPVIASSEIGAVRDLVKHGHNGFVYDSGDIKALSRHLKTLVSDADLRMRMGDNSIVRISEWDYEKCVIGIKQALKSVVKNHATKLDGVK